MSDTTTAIVPQTGLTPFEADMAPPPAWRDRLEAAVLTVRTGTPDQIAAVANLVAILGEFSRGMKALFEQTMVDRIGESGPVEANGVRYYVGRKKATKVRDKAAAFDAIFTACGGDFARTAEFMASEPWKHGALRAEFPELVDAEFVVVEEDELREGKPKLQKVDTKFLR